MAKSNRPNKKAKVEEKPKQEPKKVEHEKENEESVEEDEMKLLEEAMAIQRELDENTDKFEQEQRVVSEKAQRQMQPLIAKRSEFTKKIDQFWARVITQDDLLQDLLTEEDLEALLYCKDVAATSEKSEDKEVITLTMTFEQNPYFSNTTLFKKVTIVAEDPEDDEDEGGEGGITFEHSGIDWKNEPKKGGKSGQKAEGNKRTRDEFEEAPSGLLKIFEGETDYDEEILETFLTEIMPNPIDYFLVSGVNEDDEESEEEEGEEEEGEEKEDANQMEDGEEKIEQVKQEKKVEAPKQEGQKLSKSQKKKMKRQQKQQESQKEAPKQEKKEETQPKAQQTTPKAEKKAENKQKQTPPKTEQKKGGQQTPPKGEQKKGAQQTTPKADNKQKQATPKSDQKKGQQKSPAAGKQAKANFTKN
jgi:hypothetical protein